MRITETQLRTVIREMFLTEEVFGAQSFVYHGSPSPPEDFLPLLLDDKFSPGGGAGAMYGKGLYTVYNLKGTKTEKGLYGVYIYKLAVNLYGCISFNDEITQLIYGSPLTPAEQGKQLGLSQHLVSRLEDFTSGPGSSRKKTSSEALKASTYLRGAVKGIIFTGGQDGDVIALYDATAATPVSYRVVGEKKGWTPIDREMIRSKITQRSSGAWDEEKYEKPNDPRLTSDLNVIMKKLNFLAQQPPDQRVFKGNIDLESMYYTGPLTLPDHLRITGNLLASHASATTLPDNLHVEGNLSPPDALAQLPSNLRVDGDLILFNRLKIKSLPPDIHVGGKVISNSEALSLDMIRSATTKPKGERVVLGNVSLGPSSPITSLPDDLIIKGNLRISNPDVKTLPNGLTVMGDLEADSLTMIPPDIRLGRDLKIRKCPITHLPAGLRIPRYAHMPMTLQEVPQRLWVGHDLFLSYCTDIKVIPPDLTVGGDLHVHGLSPDTISTISPKIKVGGRFIGFTEPKEAIPRGLTSRFRMYTGAGQL